MSRNEWEEGEFKLPAAAWPAFKKQLVDAQNAIVERQFKFAEMLYELTIKAGEGKRNFDYVAGAQEIVERKVTPSVSRGGYGERPAVWKFEDAYRAMAAIFPREKFGRIDGLYRNEETTYPLGNAGKPHAPKKKDFPLANGATKEFDFDDGRITLTEDGRVATWSVSENNNACDDARKHPMGQAFFKALRKITWTRGTGGSITGNDEYNRDTHEDGGGANYTKDRFGPLGGSLQDELKSQMSLMRARKRVSTPTPRR